MSTSITHLSDIAGDRRYMFKLGLEDVGQISPERRPYLEMFQAACEADGRKRLPRAMLVVFYRICSIEKLKNIFDWCPQMKEAQYELFEKRDVLLYVVLTMQGKSATIPWAFEPSWEEE